MSHDHNHNHNSPDLNKKKIIQLFIGAFIFFIGIFFSKTYSINLSLIFFIFVISYLILGGEVVLQAIKNIFKGQVFDENFLMSIATIGAFAIGDYAEGVAVMLFYQVGEYFQDAAVRKSKKSITSLMDIRPDYANLKQGSNIKSVSPDIIKIGDTIVVKPGEKIPLDGTILNGESMVDTSALTGESVPRTVKQGESVLAGCINQSGVLTIEVTKEFGESTVAKIIDLVENAGSKKAPSENFITTFSRYYTPVVVILALLLAIIPPLFMNGSWSEWINRGLIFLVISCPCALVISIPLGFFGGIGAASRRGILVKGSNYLEALNKIDTIVFDKTGTLTKGIFVVKVIKPFGNITETDLLSLAAKAEAFSNHPIALSILKASGNTVSKESIQDYEEISGHGIRVKSDGQEILAGMIN